MGMSCWTRSQPTPRASKASSYAGEFVAIALMIQQWGTVWAVVWTSVLFGLWHVMPALEMHDSHSVVALILFKRFVIMATKSDFDRVFVPLE